MRKENAVEGMPKKFCSQCGNEIHQRAIVCSKCGARQMVAKKGMPVVAIIAIIAAIGVVGIAILGILAAIAIPQFSAYREKAFNAATISDLKNARVCVESYLAENRALPASLEQTSFKPQKDVTVELVVRDGKTYELYAVHKMGRKKYGWTSQDPDGMMVKGKNSPDSEFTRQ
jgi:Tfp pilus assembly major pilin PilA/DNA-directed RNA polymerase subunit RPC12/RpoP